MSFNESIQFNYIQKEGEDFEVLFKSEPMLIGKTYWIVVAYKDLKFDFEENKKLHEQYGVSLHNGNYSTYMFYKEGNGFRSHWSDMKNHPNYNFNDGTYFGLPKTLVKLHDKYEAELNAALEKKEISAPTQGVLF